MSFTSQSLRRIALALALTIGLLVAVPGARAEDGPTVEKTEFSETLPFTINPGPDGCPQVANTISGTAVIEHRVRTTTYPDGSRRIVDDGVSKGTAVDDQGRTYHYRYENRAIVNVPPEGPLVIVDMRDKFSLRGQGRVNRIDASFHWLWTYQPADLSDPFASFVYPPVDNWVQFKTSGSPLTCDPI